MSGSDRDKWITPGEAARRNNERYPDWPVTPKTVLDWAKTGKIVSEQRRGNRYFVHLADVIAFNVPGVSVAGSENTQDSANVR